MLKHRLGLGILDHRGISDEGAYNIRVDVGCWSSILNIALAVGVVDRSRDSKGGSSIRNTVGEGLAR